MHAAAEANKRKHTLELSRVNWHRFTRGVSGFLRSEVGATAKGLLAMLAGLLFGGRWALKRTRTRQ